MDKQEKKLVAQHHKILLRLIISYRQLNNLFIPLAALILVLTFAIFVYFIIDGEYFYSIPLVLCFVLFSYLFKKHIDTIRLLQTETENYLDSFEECYKDYIDNDISLIHKLIYKESRERRNKNLND